MRLLLMILTSLHHRSHLLNQILRSVSLPVPKWPLNLHVCCFCKFIFSAAEDIWRCWPVPDRLYTFYDLRPAVWKRQIDIGIHCLRPYICISSLTPIFIPLLASMTALFDPRNWYESDELWNVNNWLEWLGLGGLQLILCTVALCFFRISRCSFLSLSPKIVMTSLFLGLVSL